MSLTDKCGGSYDVVVIGGGSAGICAAVAAARMGSRVALVEKSERLGGMGPQAFVHTFCGLYEPDTSRPARLANSGLPAEIEAAMRERTGQAEPTRMGRVYVLPQHPDTYDRLAKRLVAGEGDRLQLMSGTDVVGVLRGDDGEFSVSCRTAGDERVLSARSVVDASANALVAQWLGIERACEEPGRLQRPAYIFSLENVGAEVGDDRFHMRLALDLVHAVGEQRLPVQVLGATVRRSVREGECFVSIDLDTEQVTWDPSNPAAHAEIEQIGRSLAGKLVDFFRQNYPFFSQASEPRLPQAVGVRESFRWIGRHELSAEELVRGEEFPDTVARAAWPMEMREDARGPKFTYFERNESSAIPLRALTARDVDGVYCAGRCISASHRALASVRVMGTCFATGQAAGMAAALYAGGMRDVESQAARIRELLDQF